VEILRGARDPTANLQPWQFMSADSFFDECASDLSSHDCDAHNNNNNNSNLDESDDAGSDFADSDVSDFPPDVASASADAMAAALLRDLQPCAVIRDLAAEARAWPLHVKHLQTRIDARRLAALRAVPAYYETENDEAMKWTTDPSVYDCMDNVYACTHKDVTYTTLSSDDVRAMRDAGVVAEVHPDDFDKVKGAVRLFSVPEPWKRRRRPIRWTVDINDFFTACAPTDMATKSDIISLVTMGSHAIAFDAKAFFDQFPLEEEISYRMCFRKGRRIYRLLTAPMGQRQIVSVGHSTMQRIAHFPDRICAQAAIIDNTIFIGESAAECEHDGKRFVERCAAVGCELNESTEDIAALVTQQIEWGGVLLDFAEKTTQLPRKMLEKIALSWTRRGEWTQRNFASHMGLLFWAVGLVMCSPGDYFAVLAHYAAVCRAFALLEDAAAGERDRFWDAPADISDVVAAELDRWTAQVLRNVPRHADCEARTSMMEPDWLVCTDASGRGGWGYLAVSPATGETRFFGDRWSDAFRAKYGHLLHRSTFTEPNAVIMSMCHLLSHTGRRQRVHIWSDSTTTVSSGNRGYNVRSVIVNETLRRLRALFPPELFTFSFAHIAGETNTVADALSRGRRVTFSDVEGAAAKMLDHFGGEAASRS
jgi:hypothetical protein